MCSKARAERKRSSSSSGFTPGSTRRNAFRISPSPNTTDELDCSTPTGRTSTLPAAPCAADGAQRKRTEPSSTGHVVALAHAVQQLAAQRGVGEPVVDRPAVGLEDHALRPALVRGAEPERQLVGLVRPLAEAGLDDREHEQRRLRAQRDGLADLDRGDLARLGPEPALGDDPVVELVVVEEESGRRRRRRRRRQSSSSTSYELEPVEAARRERQQVLPLADAREARAPEDLDGVAALPASRGRAPRPAPSARSCARRA